MQRVSETFVVTSTNIVLTSGWPPPGIEEIGAQQPRSEVQAPGFSGIRYSVVSIKNLTSCLHEVMLKAIFIHLPHRVDFVVITITGTVVSGESG